MSGIDFHSRRDDMAMELELRIAEGDLIFEHGWLVEVEHRHTCGAGENGFYGMHEPGCGRVPVFDVAAAMVRNQDEAMTAAAIDEREWGR